MVSAAARAAWVARLQVRYGSDARGRTVPLHPFCQAPLKLQRPFYPEGPLGTCCSLLLHTAGGLVGGDRLDFDIQLGSSARALLATAAAGKVYRSNGPAAEQTVKLALAESSTLGWLPQETILFAGARFAQTTRVDLAADALFYGWEIVRLGRTARGEIFDRGCWQSHLEVWQQGAPLWVDPQKLVGSPETWRSPITLAGQPALATFLWLGRPLSEASFRQCQTIGVPPSGQGGVTRTLGNGLCARYRGTSTADARAWFRALWQILDCGTAAPLRAYLQRL